MLLSHSQLVTGKVELMTRILFMLGKNVLSHFSSASCIEEGASLLLIHITCHGCSSVSKEAGDGRSSS